jgi:signal peptidase I
MNATPPAPRHAKSALRDYAETIIVCVVFIIFSRTFVFQQSKIPSGSMMDTLLIGDYIMVNRFVYAPSSFDWERALLPVRAIRRGDVVVFKKPDEPETDYIKRVIGLPGETVELRGGRLLVDGRTIEEPYVREEYRRRDERRNFGPLRIPAGQYLMLGDHRNDSLDSRVWGLVPEHLMKGRALLVWLSLKQEPGSPYPNLRQRLAAWGKNVRHFPSLARFERFFRLIR